MSPRRAARPGPPTLLLGVWGQGEATPENIAAQLDDFIDGAGNVTPKFLVPLDKELTSDAVLATAQYAIEKGYDVEVVYQEKPRTKALREIVEAASKEHQHDEPVTEDERFESTEDAIADNFAVLLGDAKDARLLFLWAEGENDEPDEDDQRLLAAVADCGVTALDLSAGLEVIDVSPADDEPEGGDEPEPEPEPEKPAKKTAAKKTAAAAEPEPEGDDEPDYETVQEWPIRRIRTYAKTVAEKDREEGVEDVPSDEELDDYKKEQLLDYLFPEDGGEPEPEPEPAKKTAAKRTTKRTEEEPPDDGAPISGKRATQIREDIEEDGGKPNSGALRRGRKAAQAAQDEPEDGGEGDATQEPDERLAQAICDLFPDIDPSDGEIEVVAGALQTVFDVFADTIIDRIAARVEKEPEASDIRKEVAPPRPPGKPRKDGATPTRRRTARGR